MALVFRSPERDVRRREGARGGTRSHLLLSFQSFRVSQPTWPWTWLCVCRAIRHRAGAVVQTCIWTIWCERRAGAPRGAHVLALV